jgi:TetR/AcrR family fatty acid metabolism transcriptional regulator
MTKTKQQVLSEFRHSEIVNAARTVFARKGYASGIMDEIAKEAGVAKGTIYLYFKSKHEIYRAVLIKDMESLKKNTLERMKAATTLRDKIGAFTLARLENSEERKDFFRIMDSDSAHLSLSSRQYRDWLREPVLLLAAEIEDAAKRGEIRPLPAEKVAWLTADITRGTIQRRLLGKSENTPAQDSEFLTSFIWSALAI